jgi:hypothetical protein
MLAAVGGGRAKRVGVVERTLTHRDVEFVVWVVEGKEEKEERERRAGRKRPPTLARGALWIHPSEFGGIGISSACLAVLGVAGVSGMEPVR